MWAHRGRLAAQPWPLWSAVEHPHKALQQHILLWPQHLLVFLLLCHSIKENIETERFNAKAPVAARSQAWEREKAISYRVCLAQALRWPEQASEEGASQGVSSGRGLLSGTQ